MPVAVAAFDNHSPEIAYLRDDTNGIFTPAVAEVYGGSVATLLSDAARLKRLSEGAEQTARAFSLDAMVDNFARGVLTALPD